MSENINYSPQKFMDAAELHRKSCDFLLKHLDTEKEGNEDIYWEVFYLSGYVLECSFKSVILANRRIDSITFSEFKRLRLAIHKLDNLMALACENNAFSPDEIILGALAVKWSPDQRYESTPISLEEIKEHFEKNVKEIHDKLKTKYA